jgi:hypothetical protein
MKQRMEFVATTGAKRNFEHDVPVPPSWVLRRSTRAESLFEKAEIRNQKSEIKICATRALFHFQLVGFELLKSVNWEESTHHITSS